MLSTIDKWNNRILVTLDNDEIERAIIARTRLLSDEAAS
jgi:hypothetical protein